MHPVALACHPDTPAAPAHGVSALVSRDPGGILAVSYVIEGDLERLRIPPLERGLSEQAPDRRRPRIGARLWAHTCCEIFIARRGLPAYHEYNFSPSGEWALLAFERYRDGAPLARESNARAFEPQVTVRSSRTQLELDVLIRLDSLSPAHAAARLSIALSAVLEERDGALSYWALRHPPGRPDFHHADGYTLELAGTDPSSAPRSA